MEDIHLIIKKQNPMHENCKGRCQGSVTVEASLVLFLFMIFFFCMMHFYTILNLELKLQSALEQTGDMQAAYAAISDFHDEKGKLSYLQCSLDHIFAKTNTIRLVGKEFLDSSWISGGCSGLYFGKSSFLKDGSTIELIVRYRIEIPFFKGIHFGVVQRVKRRIWTGTDTSGLDNNTGGKAANMVYVTPNGVAYHLYEDCNYIDVKLKAAESSEIQKMRNQDGSHYYACETCKPSLGGVVYVTSYGNRYHCTKSCSAIERDAEYISADKAGNRHLCDKCAKRAGKGR
ncbi:MAG: pilus assembly protein [Lachnospiraceae bacterium]|nr:pilus assembly protein [Lachnospiraceae bacterium]